MSLVALLPSTGYLLAYSLPLLLISVCLTFAGAFLTLDRTRVFPPRPDAGYTEDLSGSLAYGGPRKKNLKWLLEGGVGGLMIGYLFGLHTATFLALLIPAMTSSTPLTKQSFVAVWILCVIPTTLAAGRWRWAAFTFAGISGGATLGLSLCVMVHPTLLTRIIFISVTLPILLLFCVLPVARTQQASIRVACSSTGAFGVVLAIALLAKIPAWGNVWDRLWEKDDGEWGTSMEKALSATWALLFVFGMALDWLLHRKFGENPDQKWDSYLANYASSLPNAGDRAGVFQPLSSHYWRNLLSKPHPRGDIDEASEPILYPNRNRDSLAKDIPLSPTVPHLSKHRELSFAPDPHGAPPAYAPRPGFLRKKSTKAAMERISARTGTSVGGKGRKRGVKFGGDYSSGSEDEEHDTPRRPWLANRASTTGTAISGATLVEEDELDVAPEIAKVRRAMANAAADPAPEYSDYEDDGVKKMDGKARDSPGWTPEFLRTAKPQAKGFSPLPPPSVDAKEPALSPSPSSGDLGDLRAVPATPSLMNAIDRVAKAQRTAYGSSAPTPSSSDTASGSVYSGIMMKGAPPRPGLPNRKTSDTPIQDGMPRPVAESVQDDQHGHRWQNFWREVKDKAAER